MDNISWFIVSRAILVRLMFALHGLMAVWYLTSLTGQPYFWYLTIALLGLLIETIATIWKNRGNEWKWLA